jgi:desampylase
MMETPELIRVGEMGMRLEISRAARAQILAEAAASPGREICGLLLGEGGRIDRAASCHNVAPNPANSFELDPRALIAAHKAGRAGGPSVIGHYHSHPSGRAIPSDRDAANAMGDGAIWLIAGDGAVTAWRSEVPGRLSAMAMTCVADA